MQVKGIVSISNSVFAVLSHRTLRLHASAVFPSLSLLPLSFLSPALSFSLAIFLLALPPYLSNSTHSIYHTSLCSHPNPSPAYPPTVYPPAKTGSL